MYLNYCTIHILHNVVYTVRTLQGPHSNNNGQSPDTIITINYNVSTYNITVVIVIFVKSPARIAGWRAALVV